MVTVESEPASYDLKSFGKDSAGRPLRYKVVIKGSQVVAVLYNTGKRVENLKFREQQFALGEYGT